MCEVLIPQRLRCQWTELYLKASEQSLAFNVFKDLSTGSLLCANFMSLHGANNSENSSSSDGGSLGTRHLTFLLMFKTHTI